MAKMSKRTEVRLEKQRGRQQRLRDEARAARRPSRDDVARTFLNISFKEGREEKLYPVVNKIVAELTKRGFDKRQSEAVIDALIDKYRSGWTFLPRRRSETTDGNSD
jgi:hypothetical protein